MPRISDAYLSCVVYLYQSRPNAEGGVNHGAAGFLVGVPEGSPEPLVSNDAILRHSSAYGSAGHSPHHLYVVTNGHVVDDYPFARFNRRDGRTTVRDLDQWHFHKTSDLAVSPIEWSWAWNRDFSLAVVPISMFLSLGDSRNLDVGPGDDTFTVGRFIGHDGKESNLPVVRFGNIAMLPQQPLELEHLGPQNVFLIESRIMPGYSGSPVFLNIPPWELRESAPRIPGAPAYQYESPFEAKQPDVSLRQSLGKDLGSPGDRLGRIRYYTRLLGITTGFIEKTAMMLAIPSWELLDLLNYPEIQEQRSAEREKWKKERNQNPPARLA